MKAVRIGLFTFGIAQQPTEEIGTYAMELAYALKRTQNPPEVILLSPYPRSPLKWYRDFPVHYIPSLKRLPAVIWNGPRALARASRQIGLDILHDPCGIAPFEGSPGPQARIVTINDTLPFVHPELQSLRMRMVRWTTLRRTRWTSNAVIALSRHARTDLVHTLRIPPHRLFVTQMGTHIPTLNQLRTWREELPSRLAQLKIEHAYFLWVGTDAPRKNLERVLMAFARLKQDHPKINLLLIGAHSRAAWPEGVRHLGYVDPLERSRLYVGSLGLIFLPLYASFDIPILEAMAHGAPVIASHTASMSDVCGQAPLTVDPHSVPAIELAMRRCLNPDVRARLGLEGRLRAMRFSWDETGRKTLQIYRWALGRQSQGMEEMLL